MTQSTQPINSFLQRLLDSDRTWGSWHVSGTRASGKCYDLTVYPPGIAPHERVLLRLWRTFPTWGLGAWILVAVGLMVALPPDVAVLVATPLVLVVGGVARTLARRTRSGVRTLTVRLAGDDDAVASARLQRLHALSGRLIEADDAFADGTLSAVAHEAEVWRVYAELPSH